MIWTVNSDVFVQQPYCLINFTSKNCLFEVNAVWKASKGSSSSWYFWQDSWPLIMLRGCGGVDPVCWALHWADAQGGGLNTIPIKQLLTQLHLLWYGMCHLLCSVPEQEVKVKRSFIVISIIYSWWSTQWNETIGCSFRWHHLKWARTNTVLYQVQMCNICRQNKREGRARQYNTMRPRVQCYNHKLG